MFALAEGLEVNKSLRCLHMDGNIMADAGAAPIETFVRGVMMNVSISYINMSNNKLGN